MCDCFRFYHFKLRNRSKYMPCLITLGAFRLPAIGRSICRHVADITLILIFPPPDRLDDKRQFQVTLLTTCRFTRFQKSVFRSSQPFSVGSDAFNITSVSQHRATITCNISKAQRNRFSRQKVISILLLSFFVPTHGRHQPGKGRVNPTI